MSSSRTELSSEQERRDGGRPRSVRRVPTEKSSTYRASLPWRIYNGLSTRLDQRFGWSRLPVPLSLAVLVGLRNELRRQNLHDSNLLPTGTPLELPPRPADDSVRTADGSYNDLRAPRAGMAGARFGRNIPLASIDPDPEATLLEPTPREVSRRLLTRTEFQSW